jgi:peptide chain release factor subunit 1
MHFAKKAVGNSSVQFGRNNKFGVSVIKFKVLDLDDENVSHFHACQAATSDSMKEHKLRRFIACLSDKEARAMEFVSLYTPREASTQQIIETVKKESDSAVTKSERATKRLQDALKGIVQQLKLRQDIPENGMAIFAGTFAQSNSESEVLNIEEVVPPMPIIRVLLAVDDHFHLEPLRDMLREQRIVGVLSLDSKEASFGVLDGERLEIVENISSGIPGKSGKGGQSQRRYERERDMEVTYFFQRVAEHAAKAFLENCRVAALIVGGPGLTKDVFLKNDYLHNPSQVPACRQVAYSCKTLFWP